MNSTDKTLVFESKFESGNLEMAVKLSDTEYNLTLQNDINTSGNTQWFFFRVSNTSKNLEPTFNIINLGKGESLYSEGMKVLTYSEAEERLSRKGWERAGDNISYSRNGILKPNGKSFFSFSFSYQFKHSKDTVYFAYSYPYTYTDLMRYLLSLENDTERNSYFSRRLLCKTIGGNRCDYVSITSSDIPEYLKHRKGVLISARTHPGETVGSWVMHGILEFLTGPSSEAALIRDHFVVRVIPMMNPDGVINGNYRTNLAGTDLNRKWKSPSKILQPTVYAAKKLIKSFGCERDLELVCDLHGHSRSMGCFVYGCNKPEAPEQTRIFPLVLSKISSMFKYNLCSFRMQKSKESTLRISMYKELKVSGVYTLESSFCGSDGFHYTIEDLKNFGRSIVLGLMVVANVNELPKEIAFTRSEIMKEFKENESLLVDNPENFSESDSDPSEDDLDEETLRILMPPLLKKRKAVKSKEDNYSKLTKFEKKSFSAVRRREVLSTQRNIKNLSPDKRLSYKRCVDCGELELPFHECVKKMKKNSSPTPSLHLRRLDQSPTINCSLTAYVNHKGKTVRDQATQTMYRRKMLNSDSSSIYNGSINNPSPLRSRLESLPKHRIDPSFMRMEISLSHVSSVLDVNGKHFRVRN